MIGGLPSRRFARRAVCAAVALLFVGGATQAGAPESAQNLVFILIDDVGWGDLGAYGGTFVRTPRLDQLAREGMVLRRYYANGAMCSPTRAAILTGRHPIEFGLRRALQPGSLRGIPSDVPTIAERLRAAGYATGHFGKWHVGDTRPEQRPRARGFDRSVLWIQEHGVSSFNPSLIVDDAPPAVAEGHLTDLITDAAIEFIRAHADRPFFANVWHRAAHRPLDPVGRWAALYPWTTSGRYAALLSHADEQIGRVLDVLDELGIADRTLVVVASDNGAVASDFDSNGGLRGVKSEVTEGGIRVPAIVRWPGRIAPGSVNDSLALSFDWLPTLADCFGLDVSDLVLRGRSLCAALRDGAHLDRDETTFWESTSNPSTPPPAGEWKRYAARRGRYKLVVQELSGSGTASLFDVESDPTETVDLAAAQPAVVARLEAEYRDWRRRLSRVEPTGFELHGAAAARDGSFDLHGGAVVFAADDRFLVHDGEFAFRTWLTAEALGPGDQLIAQHGRSWRLLLDPEGRLRLDVQGPGQQTSTTLTSAERLSPGVEHAVVFTIHGWEAGLSTVRLFVDGELAAQSTEIPAVDANDERVRMGSASDGSAPLVGRLRDPRFYLSNLTPSEVRDADGDGWDDASDNCPFARNGALFGSCTAGPAVGSLCSSDAECGSSGHCSLAQEDADGDGAGDACDNCILNPNGPLHPDSGGRIQLDADRDGFGNACDADFDGDGVVGSSDYFLIRRSFFGSPDGASQEGALDLNGDGRLGAVDYLRVRAALGQPPGPSGLACAGAAPCSPP